MHPATRQAHRPEAPVGANASGWWIAALTFAVIVSGMAYSILWPAIVQHKSSYWIYPFDLFNTVRVSRWIEYGAFSYIYNTRDVVTLPGFALLLTPFVKLSEELHLITTFTTVPIPRPTQWLMLGPLTMSTSAVGLAGTDALARSLDIPLHRRRLVMIGEAAAAWVAIVRWGHPEDVIALGLCAMALGRAIDGRRVSAGWLFGGAVAMQLYVVLVIPVVIGYLGVRKVLPLLARTAFVPGAIFLALVIPNPGETWRVLVDQPTSTVLNHPTPWALVAPRLPTHLVAGGPGRIAGFAMASVLGLLAHRVRSDPTRMVWAAAAALALRCLTEAAMVPYYVDPFIGLALLAIATRPWRWGPPFAAAGAALTVLTYSRAGIWWYGAEMAAAIGVMLLVSFPRGASTERSDLGGRPDSSLLRPTHEQAVSSETASPAGPVAASVAGRG